MKTPFRSLAAILPLLAAPQAGAAVLANYTFDGGATASSDTFPGSSAGSFAISGGSSGTQFGFSTSTNQPFIRTPSLTGTKDGAITNNDYFTFTVAPEVGTTYPLGQLRFSFGGSNLANGSSADDFTAYLSLQVQVGAGAFFDVGPEFAVAVPFVAGNSTPQLTDNLSINLSGIPSLQNTTEPVTFRFYLYSTSINNDGKIVRMDNVVLDTVPEPSFAGLGVLGSALLLRRRRSRLEPQLSL